MNYDDYLALSKASIQVDEFREIVENNLYKIDGTRHQISSILLRQDTVVISGHTEFRGEFDECFEYEMPWDAAFYKDKMRDWLDAFKIEQARQKREKEEQEKKARQERLEAEKRLAEREAEARKTAAIREFLVKNFGAERADKIINGEIGITNDAIRSKDNNG